VILASTLEWLKQRFELSRGEGGSNVRPMEGLRGFAVFLVFLVHYTTLIDPWVGSQSTTHVIADALHTVGNAGVDLFFVLSGYLIYGSLIARPQPFGRFMSRRVQRIYPAFTAVFLTYVALSYAMPNANKIPAGAFDGSIYLIENFLLLPGLFPIEPLITVAWSLSYEIFFYLAIPLVIAALALRNREPIWRFVFFVGGVAAAAIGFANYGGPVRLLMFVSGMLLFETIAVGQVRSPGNSAALVVLAAGLLSALVPARGVLQFSLGTPVLFVSFFVLCLTCFREPTGWLARAFSWTPVRWLGNMSYSYYLLHGLALKAVFLVLGTYVVAGDLGPAFFWGVLPPMFLLTLLPAAALFLLIERPFSLAPHKSSIRPEAAESSRAV
jgi:exopolysaccharide production protein ExoZ